MNIKRSVLFVIPYPLTLVASQRFRFEQYIELLTKNGFSLSIHPLVTARQYMILKGNFSRLRKILILIGALFKRVQLLIKARSAEFIFIHREAFLGGPPIIEWFITKVLKKKIIYDFDDAIWMTDNFNESRIEKILRWRTKVSKICAWSYKVSCGNDYLCNYAKRFNNQVILNPTTIDTEFLHKPAHGLPQKNSKKICVGWTGSHSTLKYLTLVEEAMLRLEVANPNLEWLVIADKRPSLSVKNLRFIPWSLKTEISGLMEIDIGIMPLPDDEWAKGKCGFKALQYMALGIPAVASPVGVNTTIIDHGKNGFLCTSTEAWEKTIQTLIEDKDLRKRIGENSIKKIETHYSVASNSGNFLSLFE